MHRGIPTLVRQARASYARSRKVRADPIKSEELRLKSEADRLKAETMSARRYYKASAGSQYLSA